MVGSYPPTQTQNLKYVPSPTHLAEDSQSPLNPTYSQNVLHHIDGVDAISRRKQVNPSSLAGENTTNPGSYIGELDEFERLLAMIDILPMEMKVRNNIDGRVSNVFAKQCETKSDLDHSNSMNSSNSSNISNISNISTSSNSSNNSIGSNNSIRSNSSNNSNNRNNKTDEDQTDEDHSNEEVKNSPINKTDEDHSNDPFTKKKAATNKKPKSSTYFSDEFRPEAGKAHSTKINQASGLNTKEGKEECIPDKDVKSELTGDSLLQHFGFELDATRVVQRDGPSDGRRRGGCGGGPGTANRGGRGRSNHGAQGAVSKNRTSLDPSVNIGCAELLSYTAYGEYPRVKAFQNSAAFVSAAFGGSGIQFNGTRFAPVNESYQ